MAKLTKKQLKYRGIYQKRRAAALRKARQMKKVSVLFVTRRADIRYLSGCTEGGSALVFGESWAVLYTSKMFKAVVTKDCPGTEVCVPKKSFYAAAVERVKSDGARSIGIQENELTVSQHKALKRAVKRRTLKDVGDLVIDFRAVKDDDEIRLTRKAVRIAERAFRELIGQGAGYFVGKTERELAAELDYRMLILGADRQAFAGGTIVGSGPATADCHHLPTSRKVRSGEPVLFDWGAEVEGYRSDITRTVFVESVPERFVKIYETVLAAHDAAADAMRPGVMCHSIAKIARKIIDAAGYGDQFPHGLGHGVGLEVHERPNFGGKPKKGRGKPLRRNMIVTVEPGIYFAGVGGVRIEDDVLVTVDGHERLNSLPRKLRSMILR